MTATKTIANPIDGATQTTTTITIGDKTVDIPTYTGTDGKVGISGPDLQKAFKIVVLAPGARGVASTLTSIGRVDGAKGKLSYRGFAIEDLVEKGDFPQTAFIIANDRQPTVAEHKAMNAGMVQGMSAPKYIADTIKLLPRDGDSMAMLQGQTAFLGISDRGINSIKPVFQVPAIAAMISRHRRGYDNFIEPDESLSYVENLAKMLFTDADGNYTPNQAKIDYLDTHLILHAEHGQNASTTTTRDISSSDATMAASLSGGVGSLSGPKHGKANQDVMTMIDAVIADAEARDVDLETAMQDRIKLATNPDKSQRVALPGFGHAVYKEYDPRAAVLKKAVDNLLENLDEVDLNPHLIKRLAVAKRLEEIALTDKYFIDKNLFPNVDFYSGIGLSALGFPEDEFTMTFEMGRVIGQWANAVERRATGAQIERPAGIYTGDNDRTMLPLEQVNGGDAPFISGAEDRDIGSPA